MGYLWEDGDLAHWPEAIQFRSTTVTESDHSLRRAVHLVVVSDAHLLGPDDPEQQALGAMLDGLRCDVLVLLGDILHAGWTWDGQPHPRYQPFFAAVEAVVARGIEVRWVPGNHDFGVEPPGGVRLMGAHRIEVDGVGVLLAHGDEPDRDLGYRALSRVLRGPVFGALVHRLGPERGTRLLDRLAGPRHPADASPPEALVTAQRAWATGRLRADDVDLVVMGHSHVLGEVPLPGGAIVHTGAWYGLRSWLEIVDGERRLHGAPVP